VGSMPRKRNKSIAGCGEDELSVRPQTDLKVIQQLKNEGSSATRNTSVEVSHTRVSIAIARN